MTPEQLKASILQYAMEGKLVQQDPNDEPASELVKKIENEKAKFIKEGKIKKNKKLPVIEEDEKPFNIPYSWEWVRLGNISSITTGKTPSKSKSGFYGGTFPFIKPADIQNTFINYKTKEFLTQNGLNHGKIAHKNDVLITCIGNLGRNNVITKEVAYNQQINGISPIMISSKLLHYFMLSTFFINSMYNKASSTTLPILNQTKLSKLLIPLPPLEEQKRIVTKIEKLMPLVDKYAESYIRLQKINNEFEDKLKQSVLQYAMEGKLVKQNPNAEPASELIKKIENEKAKLIKEVKIKKSKKLPAITDDEKLFDIPDTWEWVRVGNIAKLVTKGTTPKGGKSAYVNEGIKFYRAENIKEYSLKVEPIKCVSENVNENQLKRSKLNLGDILITIAGTLGNVAVVRQNNLPGNVNQAIAIVRLVKHKKPNENYLVFALSNQSKELVKKKKTTSIPNLTLQLISEAIIPLPPLEEQKRIVTKIKRLMPLIDELKFNS